LVVASDCLLGSYGAMLLTRSWAGCAGFGPIAGPARPLRDARLFYEKPRCKANHEFEDGQSCVLQVLFALHFCESHPQIPVSGMPRTSYRLLPTWVLPFPLRLLGYLSTLRVCTNNGSSCMSRSTGNPSMSRWALALPVHTSEGVCELP
jgi:hypothetical protein